MICRSCTANFKPSDRNKHLTDFSQYENSEKCLTCLIEALHIKQNKIYPLLAKAIKQHENIKAIYFASTKKVSLLNDKFKVIDYERNMILHSIHMEKQLTLKKQLTKKKTSKKKSAELSTKAIKAMLANLPETQRAAVLANFQGE